MNGYTDMVLLSINQPVFISGSMPIEQAVKKEKRKKSKT